MKYKYIVLSFSLLLSGCSMFLTQEEKRNLAEELEASAETRYMETKYYYCNTQSSGQMLRLEERDIEEYARWRAACINS